MKQTSAPLPFKISSFFGRVPRFAVVGLFATPFGRPLRGCASRIATIPHATIALLLCWATSLFGQQIPTTLPVTLVWDTQPTLVKNQLTGQNEQWWRFAGSSDYDDTYPQLSYYVTDIAIPSYGKFDVIISNATYSPIAKVAGPEDAAISSEATATVTIRNDRGKYTARIAVLPLRKNGANFQKLETATLRLRFTPTPEALVTRGPSTYESALLDGDIYKIGVAASGVYKLDFDFLKNTLGIANLESINPDNLQLFGNGGGMLPDANATPRPDDLTENAIEVAVGSDQKFSNGDYILFYATDPYLWKYNATTKEFDTRKNIYADTVYYFIKIGNAQGLRIASRASANQTPDYDSKQTDFFARIEEDKTNLLDQGILTHGSGKLWLGDYYGETVRERNYTFKVPNLYLADTVSLRGFFVGSSEAETAWKIERGSITYSGPINNAEPNATSDPIGAGSVIQEKFLVNNDEINLKVKYPAAAQTNEGWLDYLQINARRSSVMSGSQTQFTDSRSIGFPYTNYGLGDIESNTAIWDITNPMTPIRQENTVLGAALSFVAPSDILRQFIAYQTEGPFPVPTAMGKVANQNLHALDQVDMLIVYHPDFEAAALRLAEHRRQHTNLTVAVVTVQQIYNEFSSGAQDPVAIRDISRMLLERSDRFKYLLLFGDGSFDYKNLKKLDAPSNFVPTYETDASYSLLNSFPADDFFSLLSPTEGGTLAGALDIAVGRFVVKTAQEADETVNKVIYYETNRCVLGDWRNRATFLADDEDSNTHLNDNNNIATLTNTENKQLNVNKIFFDAYRQEAGAGGTRIPGASDAFNNDMFRGLLMSVYLGHGGPSGWAQERVLREEHINNWQNMNGMPLMITATCSFAGFDDCEIVSAGEQCFLNPNGGAIALFSTTRAVYASQNAVLTRRSTEHLLDYENGRPVPIGEVMRRGKNSTSNSDTNNHKFLLIGDPALSLAVPKNKVVTTSINGRAITDTITVDTIRALQKVTIQGQVTDREGNLISNFNGKIYPTIFDKPVSVTTLGQDPGSIITTFKLQQNIVFRGAASVTNGIFTFSFVVPKDINYTYDYGKISYYANNDTTDATGAYTGFVIGGTDPNAIADNQPPQVKVYMNTELFTSGGIVTNAPILLAKITDDNGINIAGTSIGHDLSGILSGESQNTYSLNSFYEAALDNYTSGGVRFPMYDLPEGRHNIKVRAWDIANNPGEGEIEFIVSNNGATALDKVLNYPNPFTDLTRFEFNHPFGAQNLQVMVRIFSVSGRLVKTIQNTVSTDCGRVSDITWDGRDDFGDQLARGVYVYKISVGVQGDLSRTANSEFEKLVILK